jgi:hypothetical protein
MLNEGAFRTDLVERCEWLEAIGGFFTVVFNDALFTASVE